MKDADTGIINTRYDFQHGSRRERERKTESGQIGHENTAAKALFTTGSIA